MPNRKYANSTRRELQVKKELEDQGWFAIRASGSHGTADVLAVRPVPGSCSNPAHYEVRFVQIKTSQAIREETVKMIAEETACGFVNVEYHYYPVKNEAFFALERKRKEKAKKKVVNSTK
jgi:hypothetical protein